MPLFYVEIEKRLGSEFWTNRYIVTSPTLVIASNVLAVNLLNFERAFHADVVTFTRYRVSTVEVGDEQYVIVPISQQGLRGIGSSTLLPLFNTLRVDLPAASGRPSRKYYRGVLLEGDISGDLVTFNFNSFMAALVDNFAETSEDAGVVDPQGEFFSNAVPMPNVQMRQLRRSRRRRTNGGGVFQ